VREERWKARFKGCSRMAPRHGTHGWPRLDRGVVTLSSGDNFLAGPEFNASLAKGVPFYDSTFVNADGYDALAIGNHEFDFGPDILADFISGVNRPTAFLSANLDFALEPRLKKLEKWGHIAKSLVVHSGGEKIGIVGATTETLNLISSPRNTKINAVLPAVQAEIDRLTAKGVKIIVLISHLQGIEADLALIPELRKVDIVIAGGGDELLINSCDPAHIVPTDAGAGCPFGPYPLVATNKDGQRVPVVTTAGDLKYLGRLEVLFDDKGRVLNFGGDALRVAGGDNPDAVKSNKCIQERVVEPVQASIDALAANVIATSEVALEGRREPGVRTQETNLGNLVADALLYQANESAPGLGLPLAHVALQNGGGIRNNNLIPAGNITELTTFDILPFSNFTAIVPNISPAQFKQILERTYSGLPAAAGQFAQISGFSVVVDPNQTAQVLDPDGNIVVPGERVQQVTLTGGTMIVNGGAVVPGAPSVNIATIDFLAQGGDGYPFAGAPFTTVGVSYQQALFNFIIDGENGLNGIISTAQYPEGGQGRITVLP
jgi:5'-nucleotidase